MRYEGQLNVVNAELQSVQNQLLRFKRERDTYKHMLESAQKTIGELRELKNSPKSNSDKQKLHYDEVS